MQIYDVYLAKLKHMRGNEIMTTEQATIVAAVIAALASIFASALTFYSIRVTKRGNKENILSNEIISKKVQEGEDIRNEAQIDANITWSARVEWIQNVRRITAEFIVACYKYIQSNKNDEYEQIRNFESIQEKKYLLLLYFGPDDFVENEKKAKDICDKTTNKAKNEMIIDLINKLVEQLRAYFMNEAKYKQYHEDIIKCVACENAESGKVILCEKGTCTDDVENFTENDCKIFQKEQESKEKDCKECRQAVFNNINLLTEAMRIYLKVEWNCTKNRKK